MIAVDIPIGTGHTYPRPADVAARKFVGRRRSSVFLTPPRPVLQATDYSVARQLAREQFDIGVSAQAYSPAPRIFEVDEVARLDPRIIEVYPGVSFKAMAGDELRFPKTSWNGLKLREGLLEYHGIQLPDNLGDAGVAKPDDVVDAATAAWTAHRYAAGVLSRSPKLSGRLIRTSPSGTKQKRQQARIRTSPSSWGKVKRIFAGYQLVLVDNNQGGNRWRLRPTQS